VSRACWICGSEADGAEHLLTRIDSVRAHGKEPNIGPSALSNIRGHKESSINILLNHFALGRMTLE
jgi:hypothetical protein